MLFGFNSRNSFPIPVYNTGNGRGEFGPRLTSANVSSATLREHHKFTTSRRVVRPVRRATPRGFATISDTLYALLLLRTTTTTTTISTPTISIIIIIIITATSQPPSNFNKSARWKIWVLKMKMRKFSCTRVQSNKTQLTRDAKKLDCFIVETG